MASMYAVYHGPNGLRQSPGACTVSPAMLAAGLRATRATASRIGFLRHHPCRARTLAAATSASTRRARGTAISAQLGASLASAFRSTKRPRRKTSRLLLGFFARQIAPLFDDDIAPTQSQIADRESQLRISHASGFQHATTPKPRCCVTSAGSSRAIFRSATR